MSSIDIIDMLKRNVTNSMIEALRNGEITLETIELKEFLSCEVSSEYAFDLMKAVGLVHFADNKEAQLIVNDFIGLLKDMFDEGEQSMDAWRERR